METSESCSVTVQLAPPIALIAMVDAKAHNAVCPELHRNMREALQRAVDDQDIRVVIVAGLPEMFSCGGAQEVLARAEEVPAHSGYEPFARALAHSPLPVVAAMNGHAFGAGLVFGLYADVPVLSERSVYSANFLQYGMAPYMGATYILRSRLGAVLGSEMLLTARGYRGSELRSRGASVLVVGHNDVISTATAIANRIAAAPRRPLELVKQQLAARTIADADAAMATELEPHHIALGLPFVRERAAASYGPPTPYVADMPPACLGLRFPGRDGEVQ
ncbi:MAG: enoyl-CoA hydratase/isomerase family protein [Mycobacterium sp.]|nr:enoyl-CoA hydratase/isomerase family protein [Mycobacterium sp.]